MEEIWKDIEGYVGHYQASNLGRIRSLDRTFTQWNEAGKKFSVKPLKGKVMKGFSDKDGYLRINLTNEGKKTQHCVHRLVAQTFIPNPENKLEVNHKNGIKDDNAVLNLEWATRSENAIHALREGLYEPARGERKNGKLKEYQVIEIHALYATGSYTQAQLAEKYSIGSGTVSRIINGKEWSHVYKRIYNP